MSEFVKFIPGINPTRAKKQYGIDVIEYYDQNAFEYDYGQRYNFIERVSVEMNIPDELALKEGDVVISNSMQLATIVGKENTGRVLPLNFTKVEFVDGNIDKRYFIYIFNCSNNFNTFFFTNNRYFIFSFFTQLICSNTYYKKFTLLFSFFQYI